VQLIGLHLLCDLAYEAVDAGEYPAVLRAQALLIAGEVCLLCIKAIQDHIGQGKAVGIPEDIEHPGGVLHRLPGEVQVLPWRVSPQDIEAKDVCSEFLNDLLRLDDVANALGHLASLVVQGESVHEDALVRSPPEGDHGCSQLRVEPAPGLVVPLGDEVGRPPFIEILFMAGEPECSPGGHSAVKPDIEDIRGALHLASAGAVQKNRVHLRAVQIVYLAARPLLQFRRRAYHLQVAAGGTAPDGKGNSPVPLPGDAPVPGVVDPVGKPRRPCPLRIPGHPGDLVQHPVPQLGYAEEPLGGGDEYDGGLAAPAVAVAVRQTTLCQESFFLLQIGNDQAVCLLDIEPLVLLASLGCVPAVLPHGAEDLQMMVHPQLVVLQTVSRSYVNASGVLRSHEVGGIDAVHYLLLPGDHITQRVLIMKLLHLLCR